MVKTLSKNRESFGDRVFGAICFTIVTVLLLIVLYPLWYIVICSFSDPVAVGTNQVWIIPVKFHLGGYTRVLSDPDIMTGYANTFFYTIVGTLINLAVTLPAAYSLSKKSLPGRGFIILIFMITMYFGGGLVPTYLQIKSMGLLNTRTVLLISGALSVYNMIVCRSFFLGIPKELEEAATIDGAGVFRTFTTIVLPISKALLGVMVLYYGIGHWNSYFGALVYLSDETKMPLQIFLRRILILSEAVEDDPNMLAEAAALKMLVKYSVIVVSSLPVMILYPCLQKYFDKGVLLGSVKG